MLDVVRRDKLKIEFRQTKIKENIMKSIKLFLLFVCLFTVQVKAQTPVVQMMEGEIRAGLTTPIGGFHTGKAVQGTRH